MMKTWKKAVALLLAACMATPSLAGVSALAASESFSLTESTVDQSSGIYKLTLHVQGPADTAVMGLTLGYDPNVISPVSAEEGHAELDKPSNAMYQVNSSLKDASGNTLSKQDMGTGKLSDGHVGIYLSMSSTAGVNTSSGVDVAEIFYKVTDTSALYRGAWKIVDNEADLHTLWNDTTGGGFKMTDKSTPVQSFIYAPNTDERDYVELSEPTFTYTNSDQQKLISMNLSVSPNTIIVAKENQIVQPTLTGIDAMGDNMTPPGVTYEISTADGVSVDGNTGVVTITKAAQTGSVTLTASTTAQGVEAAKATIAITRPDSEPEEIKIATSGSAPIVLEIPVDDTPVTLSQLSVTVKDQFGDIMQNPGVVWTMEPDNITGVSVNQSTGEVTVTKEAAQKILKGDGQGFSISASADKISDTVSITVKRADSIATAVKIFGTNTQEALESDTIVIPKGDTPNTKTYSAKTYDQYDAEVEPVEEYTWTLDGVAQANSTVSVGKDASEGEVTLKATGETSNKTAQITISVINKAVATVTMSPKPVTYNGKPQAMPVVWPEIGTGTTTKTVTYSIDEGTPSTTAPTNAGTYTVTAVYENDTHYGTATATLTIDPATVTVTPGTYKVSKVYDGTPAAGTPSGALSVSGIVDTAVEVTASAIPVYASADVGTSNVSLPISLNGNEAGNYKLASDTVSVPAEITKATITAITTAAPSDTISANDANNAKEKLKEAITLPNSVSVSYGDGKSATLDIVWGTPAESFNIKGGTYTFKGAVITGNNFNTYTTTLDAKLTVTPVKLTSVTGVPTDLTLSKSQVTGAAALTGLGFPAQVTLNFDSSVPAQTVDAGWDKTLEEIKAKAGQVTDTADQDVTVTLVSSLIPAWATVEGNLPGTKVKITNKFPIPAEDITFEPINTVYGSEFTPSATVKTDDNYAGVTYTYTYTDAENKAVEKPVNAGTYQVTVTVENASYKGTKTVALTIAPKAVTGVTIELPAEYAPVYAPGKAHEPTVTVKDGDKTLVKDTDYTVAYTDNVNAGTATVTVTGKGNYGETKTATFEIAKAPIADLVPTITGTAEAGKLLTAKLPGVALEELKWSWTIGGGDPQENHSFNLRVQPNDSNQSITVTAVATEENYTGSSKASEAVTVAKYAIYGNPLIEEEDNGGTVGKLEVGDVLKVTGYIEPDKARIGSKFQWYRNGATIEGASGTLANDSKDPMAYTITEADANATLKLVWTPNDNFVGSVEEAVVVGKTVLTASTVVLSNTNPAAEAGQASVGDELKVAVTGAPEGATYTITWVSQDAPIGTGETYTVKKSDLGRSISVILTGTGEYTGTVRSSDDVTVPYVGPEIRLSAQGGDGTVTASWSVVSDGGAPVQLYAVGIVSGKYDAPEDISGTGLKMINLTPDTARHTFSGLTNGQPYTVILIASNGKDSDILLASATPSAPSGGGSGGGSGPSGGGNQTDIGSNTENNTVTADVSATKNKDGSYTATVSTADAKKLVEAAKKNEGAAVVITPDVAKDAEKVTVTLPVSAVTGVVDGKASGVTVSTPVADVLLSSDSLKGLAGDAKKTVSITAEKTEGGVSITVQADSKSVDKVEGGLTAKLAVEKDAGAGTVAVLVKADGTEEIIKKSVLADGKLVTPLDGSATVKIVDNSKTFADMDGHWAGDSVDFASARELFQGVTEDSFAPNMEMTRGMLVTVLFRLEGEQGAGVDAAFSDVHGEDWYADAVIWAAGNKIVEGMGDGSFTPNSSITREQLTTMMYRCAQAMGLDLGAQGDLTKYSDGASVSGWAGDAMGWAVGAGLVSGKDGARLDPTGTATRAEVATILQRFVEFAAK